MDASPGLFPADSACSGWPIGMKWHPSGQFTWQRPWLVRDSSQNATSQAALEICGEMDLH